jgi:nucleoside-diphosphate-sugar epimerase
MKVLIIGGTYFSGKSLSRFLHERGDEVVVANRGRTAHDLPEEIERWKVDIGQTETLREALGERTFDACVHMIPGGITTTGGVLETLHGHVGRYLQCGSTGVYAPLRVCPADESHPCDPPDELGGFRGKLEADEEAARLCGEWGLPLQVLRPTNIMGPGAVPIDIWGARNPKFFQRVLDGKVISIPDHGQTLLQPVHKDDLARGFVNALDHPDATGVFNITSEYAVTLDYYVQTVGTILGKEPMVEHVPSEELLRLYPDPAKLNPGGLKFLRLDMCFTIEKAQRELGYVPQWQPEDALEQNIEWMAAEGLITR